MNGFGRTATRGCSRAASISSRARLKSPGDTRSGHSDGTTRSSTSSRQRSTSSASRSLTSNVNACNATPIALCGGDVNAHAYPVGSTHTWSAPSSTAWETGLLFTAPPSIR
jgi:hypothetical protein